MKPTPEAFETFLTAEEAASAIAAHFGVPLCERTILNYVSAGTLEAVKVGRKLRIPGSSVAAFLRSPPRARVKSTLRSARRQAAAQPAPELQPSTAPEPPASAPARRQQRVRAEAPA